MRKLLIPLMFICGFSFADSLDMSTLSCGSMKIYSNTTLKEVQDNCKVEKQGLVTSGRMLGLYQVKFINSATNETVTCDFPRNDATAPLNGCR